MEMVSSSRAQQAMMAMMMSFFSNRCIRMHRIHLGGACPLTSLTVEFEWLRWDSRLPWTVPPASVPWYRGIEEYSGFTWMIPPVLWGSEIELYNMGALRWNSGLP